MTPDDVRAIRAGATVAHPQTLLLVLDHLEAAWEELANVKGWTYGKGGWSDAYNQQRERAEKAEAKSAEAFRVALLAAWQRDQANAALDRVRALCDGTERHPGKPWHVLSTAEVRAALDGDHE